MCDVNKYLLMWLGLCKDEKTRKNDSGGNGSVVDGIYLWRGLSCIKHSILFERRRTSSACLQFEWINCPIYEFELPNETIPIRRQIFCVGETKDGNYLVLGLFAWNYTEGKDGQRIYTHANFASRYAVNRITKEIIQERDRDENGDMIYDSRYDKFFRKMHWFIRIIMSKIECVFLKRIYSSV